MWLKPFVVAAIVIWAIFKAHYEVEKRVTRDPAIPRKLQEFYVLVEPLTRHTLDSEADYPAFKRSIDIWYTEVCGWIAENMSSAALSRFKDASNILPFRNDAAVSQEHSAIVNEMNKYRGNLHNLIENEAWDSD